MGPSNLKRSPLGKESSGERVKTPELGTGRLGLSLLLNRRLPQLVSLVLHLLEDCGMAGICGGMNRGKQGALALRSG